VRVKLSNLLAKNAKIVMQFLESIIVMCVICGRMMNPKRFTIVISVSVAMSGVAMQQNIAIAVACVLSLGPLKDTHVVPPVLKENVVCVKNRCVTRVDQQVFYPVAM
jgi:hypothetical protein